jgi:hypothetical protein
MKFITYQLDFTTWGVWASGLLVKDALTLVFNDENSGELIYIEVMINYSARGYGRMTQQLHYRLDGRMFWKHYQYMQEVIKYRDNYVMPVLDALKGEDFKSVNAFIKEYNKRAYTYYG